MKRLYALALLGACAIGNISAQYRIDLSKVTYPSIEYLELGNPGEQPLYDRGWRASASGDGGDTL